MNYTEKYHLPQWEETDRVMRTDFNQMCRDIESGIDGAKAETAKAQNAADNAQSTANTALAHKNYVIGTYHGKYGMQTIELGFKAALLLIYNNGYNGGTTSNATGLISVHSDPTRSGPLKLTDTGFELTLQYGNNCFPSVNEDHCTYTYIAFR